MSIQAQDFFTDSVLFDATITAGKGTQSYRSSAVTYDLTCKKCGEVTSRRGNSSALLKCGNCKRSWNYADNTITENAKAVVAAPVEAPVEAAAEAPVVDEVVAEVVEKVKPKRSAMHYVNLIRKAAEPIAPPPVVEKKEYVIEILDHYDTRRNGLWTRAYYCAWYDSDELTFVLDEDFEDGAMIAAYEDSLPVEQRFKTIFKNPRAAYAAKSKTFRTEADVLRDAAPKKPEVAPVAAEENIISNDSDEEMVIIISKKIVLKKGEKYTIADGFEVQRV